MFIAAIIAPFLMVAAPDEPQITVQGFPWAPFISPMGEPFRSHLADAPPIARWFAQADRDHDGTLTAEEMRLDADRFFATLDTDHDGQLDPTEMNRYEWDIAPEIQVNEKWRRPRGEALPAASRESDRADDAPAKPQRDQYDGYRIDGLQGAARYGLLNLPQPVASADADFNRSVSLSEFEQAATARFRLLDTGGLGRIGLVQLEARLPTRPVGKPPKLSKDAVDARIGQKLPAKD